MTHSERQPHLSVEDYLVAERESPIKHEYADGRIFAMTGASRNHNMIALNFATAVRAIARAGGCQLYIADLKVRSDKVYYYPDVVVDCGEHGGDAYVLEHPCLVVEVLSPSTEAIDRGEKFLNYRKLNSLQGYLLVSQSRRQVELYRRVGASDVWQLETCIDNGTLELPCLTCTLSLDQIYADVRFDEEP